MLSGWPSGDGHERQWRTRTPSPDSGRLVKTPSRATLSPRGREGIFTTRVAPKDHEVFARDEKGTGFSTACTGRRHGAYSRS